MTIIDLWRILCIKYRRWRDSMSTISAHEIERAPVACCTPVAEPNITPDQAHTLAEVFKALADPHRVQIVNLLANASEPVCVCDFMPQLDLAQGTVSFHLKKLLTAGLLEREQRGTWAYYSLKPGAMERLADAFSTKER